MSMASARNHPFTSLVFPAFCIVFVFSLLHSSWASAQPVFADGFEGVSLTPLNDTGMTWGANYPTGNNLDCSGETIAAQDCSLGRDATHNDDSDGDAGFSFTKLDAGGNDLAASAEAWSCTRDNVTGLTWEVKTLDGGLQDRAHTYSWYNPDPNTNGGAAGVQNGGTCAGGIQCDTDSFVQAVNALGLCGSSAWRMPKREELRSFLDYSHGSPALDTGYFPYGAGAAWSASPLDINSVWYMNFFSSIDAVSNRSTSYSVRLVRRGN